ncbi:MFS transporter [Agrococcus jejuensis]|uniref:MFS/sugar transport protein n=1 Tax=Agrococcus jejuensis TaxID=399736 RepID=A0A1G8C5V6_9MICO|nr:glycoside-pentoside-hexuronide (GPH):cation symporter [Agrococcus jejuensis]SDH40907.1 MFS/sugar transport protein [Agrococcus jejuensis]
MSDAAAAPATASAAVPWLQRDLPARTQATAIVTAGIGQNLVLTTVTTFMLVYLIEHAGLSAGGVAVVTALVTVTRIVDAVADPVMGSIVDVTRTRLGRMRPYVLASTLPLIVLTTLLFAVPPDLAEPWQLAWFGVAYVLWGFAYAMCDVPFWGLIGSAFPDPERRTRVIANVRAFGAISLGAATLGMPWLARVLSPGDGTSASGWTIAVALVSIVGMALFALAFTHTRERAVTAERVPLRVLARTLVGNRPLMLVLLGSLLGFARFVVQSGGAVFVVIAYGNESVFTLVGAAIILGMVVSAFLAPVLLRRVPARAVAVGSALASAVVSTAMWFVGFADVWGLVACIFVNGLTLGLFLVVQATMIADAVDDAERRTGVRGDGISFATLTFISKVMTALSLLVFGLFVAGAGYEAGVDVTPAMQQTVFVAITLVPAASALLSAVPFAMVRVGASATREPASRS